MHAVEADPIAAFYDRHPYPPVARVDVTHLDDEAARRAAHHLVWPERTPASVGSVLVAGCGTTQAVRHALERPAAHVVGIDVSASSLDQARALAARHGVDNLELHRAAIEDVGELGTTFDHIVCTGVLHHLAAPAVGLRALREALAPGGAMTLMVYGRHGRVGLTMLRAYCQQLGVTTSRTDLADLLATLRELPLSHPLRPLLRDARDFGDDDALADALCNPRERTYDVAELLALVEGAGLWFRRWQHQAPYLPDCGAISETPHAARIAARPDREQWALAELFRATITRHTAFVSRAEDAGDGALDFAAADAAGWVPIRLPTAIAVEERLPAGVAAALLNRAHTDPDLVLFADREQLRVFRSIDGHRPIAALGVGGLAFVERCWRHDLVAVDTTGIGA